MIVFDANDGQRYAAVHNYFVTEDTWHGIAKYFARRILRPAKINAPVSNEKST